MASSTIWPRRANGLRPSSDWSRPSRRPAFKGEPKCRRADLRKVPDKGRVRELFVLSAFGSRDGVAATLRNYSGFAYQRILSAKRLCPS